MHATGMPHTFPFGVWCEYMVAVWLRVERRRSSAGASAVVNKVLPDCADLIISAQSDGSPWHRGQPFSNILQRRLQSSVHPTISMSTRCRTPHGKELDHYI